MRPRRLCLLSLGITAVLVASATTIRPMSIEVMAERANLVIEGRALASWSKWNAQHTVIYTYTKFAVSRNLKGAAAATVIVKQPGGSLEGYTHIVHGVRYWKAGEESALFLRPSRDHDGTLVVVGLMQGNFRIERETSGAAFANNGIQGREEVSASGGMQTPQRSRIPLSEFEALITRSIQK